MLLNAQAYLNVCFLVDDSLCFASILLIQFARPSFVFLPLGITASDGIWSTFFGRSSFRWIGDCCNICGTFFDRSRFVFGVESSSSHVEGDNGITTTAFRGRPNFFFDDECNSRTPPVAVVQ